MNTGQSAAINRKKHARPIVIMVIAGIALLLWGFVIGPNVFTSRMLAAIYPAGVYDRGLHESDYVPKIAKKEAGGEKAVVLMREVHYERGLRKYPADWHCNKKYIPDSYKTNNPDEVRYIVYINKYRSSVGSYTNKGFAARIDFNVSVIDRTTGEVLENKVFGGDGPPSEIPSSQGGGVGSEPSRNDIMSWLSGVLP